jgi:hypothetical protein
VRSLPLRVGEKNSRTTYSLSELQTAQLDVPAGTLKMGRPSKKKKAAKRKAA